MAGFMNGLGERAVEAEQLDSIHTQHTGLKPPGAMRDQIEISVDFDNSLDEMFDGEIEPAMFTKP